MLNIFLAPIINAQNPNPDNGLGVGIENERSFCLIIPPNPGLDIAATEREAISACWGNPPSKPAKQFPQDFIKSAHYVKTPHYVQVTGQVNGAAYGLNPADAGTQFDDSLLSQGGVLPNSGCVGYQMYLEYFSGSEYCIRCCNDAFSSYCDPTLDKRGCHAGIPGEYGPGFTNQNQEPAPLVPVPNYHGCAPRIDVCENSSRGYVCCVSKGDSKNNLASKTTCQYKDDCVPGTEAKVPGGALLPLTTTAVSTEPATSTTDATTASPTGTPTSSAENSITIGSFVPALMAMFAL